MRWYLNLISLLGSKLKDKTCHLKKKFVLFFVRFEGKLIDENTHTHTHTCKLTCL